MRYPTPNHAQTAQKRTPDDNARGLDLYGYSSGQVKGRTGEKMRMGNTGGRRLGGWRQEAGGWGALLLDTTGEGRYEKQRDKQQTLRSRLPVNP